MDLNFLLINADRFAYEYRKHYEGDEMPVKHFKSDKGIVIISTKKLCVFYYDRVIRFKDDVLQNTTVKIKGNNTYSLYIQDQEFTVELESVEDAGLFEKYYQKYKY